ncbi:MAG: hypothetical protein QXL46_04025 [Nitrososphaerales archaeon]
MQAQIGIRYLIKFHKSYTEFLWSSTPNNPIKGSVDLRVRFNPLELSWLASNLSCTIDNGSIIAPSLDIYNRLLIYASVRPTLRNNEKAKELALLVLDLNGWDAHYWASRFRELWWKYESYRCLLKVAKAFKLFFGLD